jgi:hypothetical protein
LAEFALLNVQWFPARGTHQPVRADPNGPEQTPALTYLQLVLDYQALVPVPSLANDFSQPICKIGGVDGVSAISAALPAVQKVVH